MKGGTLKLLAATAVLFAPATNWRLERNLSTARSQEDPLRRRWLERYAWQAHEGRPTRYQKRATVSQKKRRKLARRAIPHGWKGAA